jgi:hypothetical protein
MIITRFYGYSSSIFEYFSSGEVGSGCWVLLSQRYEDLQKYSTQLLLPDSCAKKKIEIHFLH